MARLQFCDYHNMVAILEKGEFNTDFYPMVDFIAASPLRIETTDEGTHILATVGGIQRIVSEAFLGGEGSGTPTEPHHTPFPEVTSSHTTTSSIPLLSIPTAPIPTVTQTYTTPIIQYSRRARIAQSSAFPTVADEPASHVRDDSQGEACPTDSGFIADQDRATIAKSINEGEASAERISNDSEEIARVLTSMDAATVLAAGIDIARDAEVARIHAEEELQGMIDSLDKSNETTAKYLQVYQEFALELPLEKKIELISDLVKYQEHYTKVHKFQSQQRRPMTKKQKREYYMAMIKSNLGWRGSKEETERLKRKGLNLEKEQVKKQKSSEEAPEIEKSIEEFTKEKIKEMMQRTRSYWQIIRLGGSSACYQFFVDLLKQLDMEDLNQLWALVKEYLSIRPATNDKEMELWVELKRMYEPDPEDQLWTLTQNFMHASVEWKLYDLSEVHHLTAKDKEIFMLVEKRLSSQKRV
nr:hypothetical protein [Tanacetum cinerariifolium]